MAKKYRQLYLQNLQLNLSESKPGIVWCHSTLGAVVGKQSHGYVQRDDNEIYYALQ